MIDPYRAPRIQRQVPWRRPTEFTAAGMCLVQVAATQELLERASEMSRVALQRVHRLIMEPYLSEEAMAAGAMAEEFAPRDLRVDGPIVFFSPGIQHSGVFPTIAAKMNS